MKNTKKNSPNEYLSLIMLSSVIRVNQRYYTQTLLEECKCEIKNNEIGNLITDDLDLSSSDESDNKSDNGFDNAESNDWFIENWNSILIL